MSTYYSTPTQHSLFQVTGSQYNDILKYNVQQRYSMTKKSGQHWQVFLKKSFSTAPPHFSGDDIRKWLLLGER